MGSQKTIGAWPPPKRVIEFCQRLVNAVIRKHAAYEFKQDLGQIALLEIWTLLKKGVKFDPIPWTYLKIRLRGAIMDELRRQLKRVSGTRECVTESFEDDIAAPGDGFGTLIDMIDLEKRLSFLGQKECSILLRIIGGDETAVSIAQEMEISEGRVSQIKSGALKKIA
jgi:RNA polymerase sigma factor (sigma-70 family)